jgi:amidophosphoribosyltransferase
VLVDDSIVRGTRPRRCGALPERGREGNTSQDASPRILHPCYMGVDMGTEQDLIAVGREPAEIAAMVGADSLAYLSIDGLSRAIGIGGLCRACFDGEYHIPVDEGFTKDCFEGFGKGAV